MFLRFAALVPCLLLLAGVAPGGAQEVPQEEDGGEVEWRNATEATYLLNGGNAASSTLGVRNTLRRRSAAGEWRLDVTARRTDATRTERRAVGGSPEAFEVVEERDRERTAERYMAETRYDRTLRENLFAFGSTSWERNEFAGFEHRVVAVSGVGGQWARDAAWELKVGSGLTYTVRSDIVTDPARDDSFAGLRFTLDYLHAVTESTELEVRWVADGNAQEFSEVRGDLAQSVSAGLTDRLSLKTTLQLLLDNDPPVESVPLVRPDGEVTDQEVLVPLRRLDHSLSLALVITI